MRRCLRAVLRLSIPALALAVLGCATTGAGAARQARAPAPPDLRLERMLSLQMKVEEAGVEGSLDSLVSSLDSARAEADPWSLVELGFAQIPHDPDEAWTTLRRVTVEAPDSGGAAYWAWLGMADISLSWGVHQQARIHVDNALEIAPDSAPAQARAGLLALSMGDTNVALSLLRSVVSSESEQVVSPAAAIALARIEAERGRRAEAAALLDALIARRPHSVKALELRAELAREQGDIEDEIGFLEAALRVDPSALQLAERLTDAHESLGDPRAAMLVWRHVTSRRRDDPAAWRRQAELARAAGERAPEEAALLSIARLDPDDTDALRALASARARAGRAVDARDAWTELLERRPDDAPARLELARLLIDAEEYREAIGALRLITGSDSAAHQEPRVEAAALLRRVEASVGLPDTPVSAGTPDALYAAISRVVERAYRARVQAAPALGGSYSVRVVVADRSVVDAHVVENSLHDPILEALIFWTIHDARFPRAGARAEFTLPFTLTP